MNELTKRLLDAEISYARFYDLNQICFRLTGSKADGIMNDAVENIGKIPVEDLKGTTNPIMLRTWRRLRMIERKLEELQTELLVAVSGLLH